MTLVEHIRELRDRLFKASLGVVFGLAIGWWQSKWAFHQLEAPYCKLMTKWDLLVNGDCQFQQLGAADGLMLRLKLALWIALIVAAPIWLYQLWAFIAPGLHRHERKWAYLFAGLAAPLFALGVALGFIMAGNGLEVLMDLGLAGPTTLEITKYTSFMTGMMLLFGVSFEFPLLLLMLNFAGVVTGRRMLGWWRIALFLSFAFAAMTTPDPGPFGMTVFALCLSLLYFIAVGVAMLNDKRVGRGKEIYANVGDDETSSLDDYQVEPVEAGPSPKWESTGAIERRYDDMT